MQKLDAATFLKLVSFFSGDDQPSTADGLPPFYGLDLTGLNLVRANLYGANLEDANLEDANLYGANLVRANLYGANLEDANLYGANLYGLNLVRANLYGANLEDANLYGANLVRANLYGANLYGANLEDANLEDANLEDANLEYSNVVGTDVAAIYLPGMSDRRDFLYARRVGGTVLFWAGCQRGIDEATLRERLTRNPNKSDEAKALYRAAIDLLRLTFGADTPAENTTPTQEK